MNECKGICIRYKARKPMVIKGLKDGSGGRYANGQKRCTSCDIFINWDGKRCPCCKSLLRGTPKHRIWKKKFKKIQKKGMVVG